MEARMDADVGRWVTGPFDGLKFLEEEETLSSESEGVVGTQRVRVKGSLKSQTEELANTG